MCSVGDDERFCCLVPGLRQELVPAILSDPAPPNELNEVPAALPLLDCSQILSWHDVNLRVV